MSLRGYKKVPPNLSLDASSETLTNNSVDPDITDYCISTALFTKFRDNKIS